MNYKRRPPGTLSELIRLAIADARRLDQKTYAPLYRRWHAPADAASPGRCNICLAGAVIAGTLGAAPDADVQLLATDEIDDTQWANALIALNYARMGKWKLARILLEGWPTSKQETAMAEIPKPAHYEFCDWNEFKTHLNSLEERAGRLQAAGL